MTIKQLTQDQENIVRNAIISSMRGSFSATATPIPDGFDGVSSQIADNILKAVRLALGGDVSVIHKDSDKKREDLDTYGFGTSKLKPKKNGRK